MPPIPIVVDADPGIDDVVALALALRSPELDVVGITTSYGNATLDLTTRNARHLLELFGRADVPVVPGAARPLSRPLVTAPETHGASGVGYAPVPPPTAVASSPVALIDVLRPTAAPVVLITLGPLTNLALALEADAPFVRSRVARHLGMFGSIRERGNTNRWADFNAWCDPEAVHHVLGAGLGTVMVGLDVTRRMTFSAAEVAGFATSPDASVRWLGQALRFYVEFHRSQERLDGCVVNDVLPVGEVIAPGLLTLAQLPVGVDLDEGEHRGHTVQAVNGMPTGVALEVDIPRMRELLVRVFRPRTGT
jgi:inosine-uridine nucleoside N-ribohydrolase